MNKTVDILMQMIGSEVCGSELSLPKLSEKQASFLHHTAKRHSMDHLVSAAITHNKLMGDENLASFYRSEVYTAVVRSVSFQRVLEEACDVLEEEKIPYIPLKGSVIKELYPETWMRASSDVDILVRLEDHDRATDAIVNKLGYTRCKPWTHDITLISKDGIHLELHFDLVEEHYIPDAARLLKNVWDYAIPEGNGSCRYHLTDSMFYFYHIAHMAKHFVNGGCGIKPIIDTMVLMNTGRFHTEDTIELLKKGKLLKFAEGAEELSRVWLCGKEHSENTLIMQEYIIDGGCFGTLNSRYLAEQQKKGGKIQYFISHLFIPRIRLQYQFPIIEKYPILTPICIVKRWWELALGKRRGFRRSYMDNIQNMPKEKLDDISALWKYVGL